MRVVPKWAHRDGAQAASDRNSFCCPAGCSRRVGVQEGWLGRETVRPAVLLGPGTGRSSLPQAGSGEQNPGRAPALHSRTSAWTDLELGLMPGAAVASTWALLLVLLVIE